MKNLRAIRNRKRMTQLRLSFEADVHQETISSYENGKAMPSAETLCKLADFLNTSTDYLLDRTDISAPVKELSVSGLSAEELDLIAHYRKLTPHQKGKVIGFIQGLLD